MKRTPRMLLPAALLSAVLVPAVLIPSVGCGNLELDAPKDSSFLPESAGEQAPLPPVVGAPTAVPWPVVTLRGAAPGAHRVIIEVDGVGFVRSVLPDDTYCFDAPLSGEGTHELRLWAQSAAGLLSELPAELLVEHDTAAPAPDMSLCSGAPPAGCAGRGEICDNEIDDDCNGLADGEDAACSECAFDFFEPNDDRGAPRVEPGVYEDLVACGSDHDFYWVRVPERGHLRVSLRFRDDDGDVDLRLYDTDGETVLERSASVSDDEEVTYYASTGGTFLVEVYPFNGANNTYDLEIAIE